MFAQRFIASLKREKRVRARKVDPDQIGVDVVSEQVKQMLQETNQKLILMVRG